MKKLILVFATVAITFGVNAQSDSTNRQMSPPDINKTNDGMNDNREVNNTQDRDMNNSQNRDMNNNTDSARSQQTQNNVHPNGVMMQDGKMVMYKDGNMTALAESVTMTNGTKIMVDGSYTNKDGKKKMLKEGEHMDMSGNMVPMKNTTRKIN